MRPPVFMTCAAIALVLPMNVHAQDAADADTLPRALFVSQWQCPQSVIGDISQTFDSLFVPVQQELVNEGKMAGARALAPRGLSEPPSAISN